MKIEIPAVPVGPNGPGGLFRMHWRKRKKYRVDWYWLIRSAYPSNFQIQEFSASERRLVHIHQVRKRLMDPDNLVASCKVLLDNLIALNIIRDDSSKWIDLVCTQDQGREVKTTIEVI